MYIISAAAAVAAAACLFLLFLLTPWSLLWIKNECEKMQNEVKIKLRII